ncbi:exo-beta-N-acetylmuramidase NamZ domain-containing protein [Clostridium tagluense]|uniref:exo-beta-N-acetylmuramidase NamZ domain-containing protein n=1 Tax=Clostridium tagluense TaxID=360422 RepID=UPI001CF297F7|nr:exo-beta-N-acetylmuramidase NamZ domain-containing protein [Clostridium tagluense]MCB2296929.1 DUF1343 domain-containing protein [Clostridium tagluense]
MKRNFKIFVFLLFSCIFMAFTSTTFSTEKYIFLSSKQNTDSNKMWTIKFNTTLDKKTITDENIWVSDSKGNKLDTALALAENLKSVKISPLKKSYNLNETYFLNIENGVQALNGNKLSSAVAMPFTIPSFKLGDELLFTNHSELIEGKKIGFITNQTGVNGSGENMITLLANYKGAKLTALYGPEHGIDGKAKAGDDVKSYIHQSLNIPVYSLYGDTRKPTKEMLSNIDVLIFDIQDIGSRSYTYMSTLNYCMLAAAEYNKPIIVLDRPNPLGGEIVDGPVLEDKYKTFVGVDNLPICHGMTAGELANFFNRKISANLTVIPMEGYSRDMIFEDTKLKWVQSSPYIPDIASVFGYSATGLGSETSIFQDDSFKWVGGPGINSDKYAKLLNDDKLPGVKFIAKSRGSSGGVKLLITDYRLFNPAKTGIYTLARAHSLNNFKVPKSNETIVMFDKIMGTDKIGMYLEKGYTPQQIEATYKSDLEQFKKERQKYLIYE